MKKQTLSLLNQPKPEPDEPPLPVPPVRRGKKTIDKTEGEADGGKAEPYRHAQMELFRTFTANAEDERDRLSNVIEFWDGVPRYSFTQKEMAKMRDEKGVLRPIDVEFRYGGKEFIAQIHAASVFDEETKSFVDYYPSANEELVEDALRKIALKQMQSFFEENPNLKPRSGVSFSMYELREELAAHGHSRSYHQILQSLAILSRSHLIISQMENGEKTAMMAANYLPALEMPFYMPLEKRPKDTTRDLWGAMFHPLVTRGIRAQTYRQYDYAALMELPTQLARWLLKQLHLKFTFASRFGNPFKICYSTIKRDSNLLNSSEERSNRYDVEMALMKLVEAKVLRDFDRQTVFDDVNKRKIVEVIYLLHPAAEFVDEVRQANTRQKLEKK